MISRSVLLRTEKVSHGILENQKTDFVFNNFFFCRKSYRLGDNVVKYCRAEQITDECTRCTEVTNTHPEYVILTTFPSQEWLHERTSKLRYTYIDCGFPSKESSIRSIRNQY